MKERINHSLLESRFRPQETRYVETHINRITLLLATAAVLLTVLFVPLNIASAGSHQHQPYSIDKHHGSRTPTKVLFLYDDRGGRADTYYEDKVDFLVDVVHSHWNIVSESKRYEEYIPGYIHSFDSIIVIQELDRVVPELILFDLLRSEGKKVYLTGYSTSRMVETVLGHSSRDAAAQIEFIEYKGIRYNGTNTLLLAEHADIKETKGIHILSTARVEHSTTSSPLVFSFTNKTVLGVQEPSVFISYPVFVPPSYDVNDFSLIFLDLLHDVVKQHKRQKKALIRLEDVNVHTYRNTNKLQGAYRILKSNGVPFHIAFIPRYVNPQKNIDYDFSGGRRFSHLIEKMVGEGYGTLIQHGYTHQVGSSISGIGFEFWDEDLNQPLAFDSEEYVRERVSKAQHVLEKHGLPPTDIWETPHYALSELDSRVIDELYPLRYERVFKRGAFPFPVETGGSIYIPENLGFVADDDNQFAFGRTLPEIEEEIRRLDGFEDPVASVFWHPWRANEELEFLVDRTQDYGYTFVSAYDLVETLETPTSTAAVLSAFRDSFKSSYAFYLQNTAIVLVYGFFIFGALYYVRNIILLNKHFKIVGNFNMSVDALIRFVRKKRKLLPQFTILVPARNEGEVIENTIRNLAKLDYPKSWFRVVVIVDERELDDDVEVFTKTVVERVGKELNKQYKTQLVHWIEVPKWYSGIYNDTSKTYGKSTKGRALNYALQTIKSKESFSETEIIGTLDADGRLHADVLKEVAYKTISDGSEILQGPVFQVSNFGNVSLTGVAAGIELAIHHLTELPSGLLKANKVQFLAGTNYFISRKVIDRAGGWDQDALVEDAELALRIYIQQRVVAGWIGSPELEQTPPSFKVYRKQRSRWALGHFSLLKTILNSNLSILEKISFVEKIFIAQFRFIPDIGIPILALVLLFTGMLIDLGNWVSALLIILIIFAIFIMDLYGYLFRKLAPYIDPEMNITTQVRYSVKLFFFTPLLMFIQAVPRIQALASFFSGKQAAWYKTERTKEVPIIN